MKIEYIILAIVFIILLLAVLKINKKDVKLEFNKLTSYLGGKDNIIDTEVNLSRFIVTVKDIDKVEAMTFPFDLDLDDIFLREDIASNEITFEDMKINVKDYEDSRVKVPKVVE